MTPDRRRNWICMAIVVLALGAVLGAQAVLPRFDINGIWLFDVDTPRAKGIAEVTIKEHESKLSGHYSSGAFGENDFVNGTLKDTVMDFSFETEIENPNNGRKLRVPVRFTGTMQNEGAIRGTISVGPIARGTFTGKRKPKE